MHSLLTQPEACLIAQWSPLAVWQSIWPYVLMLIGFSLIVCVHELGHFALAKWAGVRVDKFAVGFGRELFGFTKGETRYSFNVLPLGGYVKMLGQEDFDDKAKELQFKDDPRSFVNKPVGRRMAIVSAGVAMNVLFACLLFMIVFLIGMQAVGTRIAFIEPDSPADRAGLLPGDEIMKINGENVLEFNEVRLAVMLAPLHEPIEFIVERGGDLKSIQVEPEYTIPESTRGIRRQIVGIAPGATREIVDVGPEIDQSRPDRPHVGDLIVEVDGIEVTDNNASEVINALVYAKGDVYVERIDPKDPDAPGQRVRVDIPPILTIFPSEGNGASEVSVLGLRPLVRLNLVDSRGRAHLAGLEPGDTVLSWDDTPYPSKAAITRAIQDCPERDIHFKVRKPSGGIFEGFVRPKRNRRGDATIQAIWKRIDDKNRTEGGPRAFFAEVRRSGKARRAGFETGDVILSCRGVVNPSVTEVNGAIRTNAGRQIAITVRKTDGRKITKWVRPERSGSIDARYNLVADDVLRVGGIVETIHGRPSPAAQAGIQPGALITAVNGRRVSRWRELTEALRENAGSTVELAYLDSDNQSRTAVFPVPHCLRTLLGAGPEARIVSIDGRKTVMLPTSRGIEEAAVGYRKATRFLLTELIGRTHVPVEYRANPLAEIQIGYIDVSEDVVDPWLGRIAFSANVDVALVTKLLKGDNAFDAVRIGVHKTYYFILNVYKILQRMIFTRSVGLDSVSGPLGIIDIGGRMARSGLVDLIFFMAIISANLAVINFLPLPIFDGGLMVFLLIEKIKGSPVSLRVQVATQMIGLFLIIGAFLYITFNDAMRLWG
ncbi:MAG: RIP metalloprotease RseP [Phycisphaerales bacterium]|nr:MAG: RIP metalloprotease RseP [Phycisphaerales bacterium]